MVHESFPNTVANPSNQATASALAGVTIKQEKITPPSSPTHQSINGTYINPSDADDKSSIGPVKSSSEILGELFQVFSSAVPEGLVVAPSAHKKKHKKEKKSKKSRHKEKESAPNLPSAEGTEKEVRVKKKHRDRESKRQEGTSKSAGELLVGKVKPFEVNEEELQAAKLNERKRRFENVNEELKDVQGPSKVLKISPTAGQPSLVTTVRAKPNKIVFKNLKDSSVLKNVEALETIPNFGSINNDGPSKNHKSTSKDRKGSTKKQRKSDRKEHSDNESVRSESSDLSLSDEETYLRERNSFWKKTERAENPFYANQSKVQEDEEETIRSSPALSNLSGSSHGIKNGGDDDSRPSDSWRFKGSKFGKSSGYVSEGHSDIDEDGNKKPFKAAVLKKTAEPIIMNIRNAVAIPPKMIENKKDILATLSRHHHRRNEGDWVAVEKKKSTTPTSSHQSLANSTGPPNMALPPPVLLPVVALATPLPNAPPVQTTSLLPNPAPPPPPPATQTKPPFRHPNRADYPQLYSSFVPPKIQFPSAPAPQDQHPNGHVEHPPPPPTVLPRPMGPAPNQQFGHQQPPHLPLQTPFVQPPHELPTSLNFPPPPIDLVLKQKQQMQQQNYLNPQESHRQEPHIYPQDDQYHFQDMVHDHPDHPPHGRHRNPFRQEPSQPPHNPSRRGPENQFRRPNFPLGPNQEPHPMHLLDQANDLLSQYPPEHELDSHFDPTFDDAPPLSHRPNPFQAPRHDSGPQNRPRFQPPALPQQQHRPIGSPNPAIPLFHQLPLFHQQRIRHHLQQMHEDQMRQERQQHQHHHNQHHEFEDYADDDFDEPHPDEYMGPPNFNRPQEQLPHPRFGGHQPPRHHLERPRLRAPPSQHQQSNRFAAPRHPGPPRFPGPNQPGNRFAKPNPFSKPNPFASPNNNVPPSFAQPNNGAPMGGYRSPSPGRPQQYHQPPVPRHDVGPNFGEPVGDEMTVPLIVEQRLNAIRNREHERHQFNDSFHPQEPILHAGPVEEQQPLNSGPHAPINSGGAHPQFNSRYKWRKPGKWGKPKAAKGI